MNYIVKTWHAENGDIHQTISRDGLFKDTVEVIISQVIHTGDAQIRAVLINMGWTPPVPKPQPIPPFQEIFTTKPLKEKP